MQHSVRLPSTWVRVAFQVLSGTLGHREHSGTVSAGRLPDTPLSGTGPGTVVQFVGYVPHVRRREMWHPVRTEILQQGRSVLECVHQANEGVTPMGRIKRVCRVEILKQSWQHDCLPPIVTARHEGVQELP
jgi:hypothetical protein